MNRILLIFLISMLFSCDSDQKKIDLKINRFEEALFQINIDNVEELNDQWKKKFPVFNDVFASQIMRKGNQSDIEYYNELLAFVQHKDMREAYDSVRVLFKDISNIEEELELAFSQFSNDFPSYPTPQVTTFFGGFNYGVVAYENHIAIGLENFLGQNSKYYSLIGEPKYLRFQKNKRFITSNVLEVWFNDQFGEYIGGKDLLSQLIYKGKLMYFINRLLPELPMHDKFRFSKDQMRWAEENEASIWKYMLYKDLLFSKKEKEFRTLINYAPFAKGMPSESPGRVGYYIGYKLVNSFMQNNELEIQQLMYLSDSRKFLKQSRYKPVK